MASTATQEQTMLPVTLCPQMVSLATEETTFLQTWRLANVHGTNMTSPQWALQVLCGESWLHLLRQPAFFVQEIHDSVLCIACGQRLLLVLGYASCKCIWSRTASINCMILPSCV